MKRMDEASFNQLIKKYGNQVLQICYLYVKNYHTAQDLTQETFIRVYNKYYTLRDKTYEKTWIMKIAVNTCKNYLKMIKIVPLSLNDQYQVPSPDHYDVLLNTNAVTSYVVQLPEKYKEIVMLYYYEEFSIKEISQILKLKETTVLQRLKRARQKLRPLLEEVL